MNKILSVLVLGAGIFFGGTYYISNEAQNSFENALSNLETINDVSVQNRVYEKGLFNSKASFDIRYYNPTLDIDMKVKVKGEIDNSIITALLSGLSAEFEFSAIDSSDEFKEMFGSDVFMTSTIKKSISGNHEIKTNFKDIDIKKSETGTMNSNGISLSVNADKEFFVNNVNFKIDRFFINSDKIIFDINSFVTDVNPTEKTSIRDFFTRFFPAKSTVKSKEIRLSMDKKMLLFSELQSSTKTNLDKSSGLLNGEDSIKIDKIVVDDIQFRDVILQSDAKNFNVSAVNKILDLTKFQDRFSLNDKQNKEIENFITEILKSNPAIGLKLDMRSDENAALSSYFNFTLNGFDVPFNQETFVFDVLEKLSFDGNIEFTPSLVKFLPSFSEVKEVEELLIREGLLIKEAGSVKSDIKFDKESKDILINDKISLMQMMLLGMF